MIRSIQRIVPSRLRILTVQGPPAAVSYSSSPSLQMPLDEFRDAVPRMKRMQEKVGRSWSAKELRMKSYDDLHKLWFVLYKEKNMLLTEQQLSRRKGIIFPQPERMRKVQKSMGAIKQVLGERKRQTLADVAQRKNKPVEESVETVEETA